jgi:hypothetical protein
MSRWTLLLAALSPACALALPLAGCGREVPDEPAIAAPGVGLPMGAIGATGVGFDAPSARPASTVPTGKGKPGKADADPLPPDPFATPPGGDDDDPAPVPPPRGKGKGPKPHSPSETTL